MLKRLINFAKLNKVKTLKNTIYSNDKNVPDVIYVAEEINGKEVKIVPFIRATLMNK